MLSSFESNPALAPLLTLALFYAAGQAMFEGILLELPLAGFFLKKFRSGAWCALAPRSPFIHPSSCKWSPYGSDEPNRPVAVSEAGRSIGSDCITASHDRLTRQEDSDSNSGPPLQIGTVRRQV